MGGTFALLEFFLDDLITIESRYFVNNLGTFLDRVLPLGHLIVLQALRTDFMNVLGVILHMVSLLKLLQAPLCWTDVLPIVQMAAEMGF